MTLPALSASGPYLVDGSGNIQKCLKGFNVEAQTTWTSTDFTRMASAGCKILRASIFWDQLETSQGVIGTSMQTSLDNLVSLATANNMYVTFNFYFGPPTTHCPSWVQTWCTTHTNPNTSAAYPANCMQGYVQFGQFATQYLANRYGNPASTSTYSPNVIAFGINEIIPDDSAGNAWLTRLVSEQTSTMVPWFRTYAPQWIAILSCGHGATAPYANAPGSGWSTQTFTSMTATPTTNFMIDVHDYTMASQNTSIPDSRATDGQINNTYKIPIWDTGWPVYPPTVTGTPYSRATCIAHAQAFFATYAAYAAPSYANCPIMLGEHGWVPYDGTSYWTGGASYARDKTPVWDSLGTAIQMQWLYSNGVYANEKWAARPVEGYGLGTGVDGNGFLAYTNIWMASPGPHLPPDTSTRLVSRSGQWYRHS